MLYGEPNCLYFLYLGASKEDFVVLYGEPNCLYFLYLGASKEDFVVLYGEPNCSHVHVYTGPHNANSHSVFNMYIGFYLAIKNSVETGNDLYKTVVRLQLILFYKDIGAF